MYSFRFIFIGIAILIGGLVTTYASIDVIPPSGKIALAYVDTSFDAGTAIGSIISWMIGLTAILTVLAISWAAVQMILATGEEEKFKKARYIMIYAFIGLFVSGLAYATVTFITRLNLTTFL